MKIIVVLICIVITGNLNILFAQENNVQIALNNFVNTKGLEHAGISFMAMDLGSNEVVAEYNSKMALPPASTIKLFSSATALLELGPYYRPKTKIYHTGKIENGILNGDIYILGGGDPSLGSRFFEKSGEERLFLERWADSIQALGIKQIKGRIVTDASHFGYLGAPEGWTWGDMGNYYGSGPSGLTLFDNMSYLYFETSTEVNGETEISCVEPYVHQMTFRNEVKSAKGSKDNSYAYGAPYLYDRQIKGSLPLAQEEFEVKVSIPDPEKLMAEELHVTLTSRGIEIEQPPVGMRELDLPWEERKKYRQQLILTHNGQTIANIAYWTNMRSINLFAEHLLCLVGYEKRSHGSTGTGAFHIQNYWESKIGSGFYITDGSGLSRNNAVSAYHFAQLLKYMKNSNQYAEFKKTLPVAGKSGTLSSVCKGQAAAGRIFAKSGTMNRIKAYSGYVETSSGKNLAFAIIVNNHSIPSADLVKKMEAVFNAMAKY
jgi:serine-type D-Ala-D-Ala carboxypeptidase/endopeptidase (penicillin-binding protein 4)